MCRSSVEAVWNMRFQKEYSDSHAMTPERRITAYGLITLLSYSSDKPFYPLILCITLYPSKQCPHNWCYIRTGWYRTLNLWPARKFLKWCPLMRLNINATVYQSDKIFFFWGGDNTELTPFTLNIFSPFLFRNFMWEFYVSSTQVMYSTSSFPPQTFYPYTRLSSALVWRMHYFHELVIPHTIFLYTVKSKGLHINSTKLTDTLMSY